MEARPEIPLKRPVITSGLRDGCVDRCPGCRHRRLSAAESALQKESWIQAKLTPWQDLVSPIRLPEAGSRWNYRRRACLAADWNGTEWVIGMRRSEEVIGTPHCPIHADRINWISRYSSVHLPAPERFPLRYIQFSGRQLVFVLKTNSKPGLDWMDERFTHVLRDAGFEGLWLHLNPSTGKRIFAKRDWMLVWGKPESIDGQGNVYGPTSFNQLIPALHEESLETAERFLGVAADDLVVDLYCGIGTGLKRWLHSGAHVIGVELGGEAVDKARTNAPGAQVLRGSCAHRVPQLVQWTETHRSAGNHRFLYLNPPRTGLESEIIDWAINDYRPHRMAYLSCSAGTLRRDLDRLTTGGFTIHQIVPFDFFPQTVHVETLVLLQQEDLLTPIEG